MSPSMSTVAPQARSCSPAVNIEGFFRAVGDAMTDYLDRFQIAPELRPLYTEEWPKERLSQPGAQFDFIGFHVVRSSRASTSNTTSRAAKGLTLAPGGGIPSQTEAGYLNEDYFWLEEAVVQFTVFSQSNARASAIGSWFQSLVLYYAHTNWFRQCGVNYLVFHARLEDTLEKTDFQDLYTRRYQFVVRVQNIFNMEAKTMEAFTFNVGMTDGSSSTTIHIPANS